MTLATLAWECQNFTISLGASTFRSSVGSLGPLEGPFSWLPLFLCYPHHTAPLYLWRSPRQGLAVVTGLHEAQEAGLQLQVGSQAYRASSLLVVIPGVLPGSSQKSVAPVGSISIQLGRGRRNWNSKSPTVTGWIQSQPKIHQTLPRKKRIRK